MVYADKLERKGSSDYSRTYRIYLNIQTGLNK